MNKHPLFDSYSTCEFEDERQIFFDVVTRVRFGGISPATKFDVVVVNTDTFTVELYADVEDTEPRHIFQFTLEVGEDITPRKCTYCGRPLAEEEKSAHKACIDAERADRRRAELRDEPNHHLPTGYYED